MSVFAAIWWAFGVRLSGPSGALRYAVPMAVAGLLVIMALRSRRGDPPLSPEEDARRGRLVGIASAAEGIAILIGVNVLANVGLRDYTAPVIALIVGAHFLPLAHSLPAQPYYWTAALLMLIGLVGLALPDADARRTFVSGAAAITLWLTSALIVARLRASVDAARRVA